MSTNYYFPNLLNLRETLTLNIAIVTVGRFLKTVKGKNASVDKDKYFFLSDNITAGKNGIVDKDIYLFCLIIQLHNEQCTICSSAHIINIR